MSKNHYIVLGVNRQANLNKIKKAYRNIAKQYHPDVTKFAKNAERFLEINHAYETLTDAEKRREYDIELQKQDPPIKTNAVSENISEPTPYYNNRNSACSFVDEFLEGFLPGFYGKERLKSSGNDLFIEMILTPEEAREGGLFPLSIPVLEPCSRCFNFHNFEKIFCPDCSGTGRVRTERTFSISMPPNVTHGSQIKLSLEDIGMRGVYLHLFVYVDISLDNDNW